jgi:hypothetical protein
MGLELIHSSEVEEAPTGAIIALNEKTIKDLFLERKILSKLSYIFLAIEIEKAENPNPNILKIDKTEFCDRWNLKISDLEKGLIDLHWKGGIHDGKREETVQLTLNF